MLATYPAEVVDENGVVRIVGTVTFTDPNNQPVFNGGSVTLPTRIAADASQGAFNGGALVVQNTNAGDFDAFGVYDSLGTEVFTVTTGAADLNDYSLVSAPFQVSLPTPYVAGQFNVASFAAGLKLVLIDYQGVLDTSNGAGIKFPTSNPHIVGAWWDNAGVLTKSAG